MDPRNTSLVARYRPLRSISACDAHAMYGLFSQYYGNATADIFLRDLSAKNGAVIVRERGSKTIRGFTTIKRLELKDGSRKAIGIFSGDTILHPDFWGDRALKDGFARYMISEMLTSPLTRVYWLLISKGYKTYMLMAQNFRNYYPRHDRSDDGRLKALTQQYVDVLFPGKFDPQRGILDFGDGAQHLRPEVAPITPEMSGSVPAIAYFEKCNPHWKKGHELPCIAEVSMALVLPYFRKQRRKVAKPRPLEVDPAQRPQIEKQIAG